MMGDNMHAKVTRLGGQFSISCPYCSARILRNKGYFSDRQLHNDHQQPCPSCKKNYNIKLWKDGSLTAENG